LTLDKGKKVPIVVLGDVRKLGFITEIDGTGEFFGTLGLKCAVVEVETDV
jgi:hypothetical protein